MESKLYYKTEEITIEEEIYELKKMLRMLDSILSRRNHCDWDLHKRAQANYQARLEELYEKKAKQDSKRDDDERLRRDTEARIYDV